MIIDARTLPADREVQTDVCIVGAGPAGLSIAKEFLGSDLSVCLLESGGLERDDALLPLSEGENVGFPYERLDGARLRCFGGNSQAWNLGLDDGVMRVRLRAMDPIDFEKREWVPHSGWPFGYTDLIPYYERAHELWELGPLDYGVGSWEDPTHTPRLPLRDERVTSTIFQFGRAGLFFRDQADRIRRSENVTAYLHANVTELETGESGESVVRAWVSCLPERWSGLGNGMDGGRQGNGTGEPVTATRFSVAARVFVLATGGTENPRLLLLSDKVHQGGLGNRHDLVGRFFMEHPHLWSGELRPNDPSLFQRTALYEPHATDQVPVMAKLTLSEEVLRKEGLLNYCVSLHPHRGQRGWRSFRKLVSGARRGTLPPDLREEMRNVVTGFDDVLRGGLRRLKRSMQGREAGESTPHSVFRLNHMWEQAPNPASRVTLSERRDPLGLPRVRLDWQLSDLDIRTLSRAQTILDEALRSSGVGRLRIDLRGETPPPDLHGGWHHMGTTRMHPDPKQGVVDPDGRVHGVRNLYVAGSSVFPTGGYANPTLTIVALAIRLGDHLKKDLRAVYPIASIVA